MDTAEFRGVLEKVLDEKLRGVVADLRAELQQLRSHEELKLPMAERVASVRPAARMGDEAATPSILYDSTAESSEDIYLKMKTMGSQYEKFYDVAKAFEVLCDDQETRITVPELLRMRARQTQASLLDPSMRGLPDRFSEAIQAINESRHEVTSSPHSLDEHLREINLDTFTLIMRRREELANFPEEILETVDTIREVLLKEETSRKVAQATNTSRTDLEAANPLKRSFADVGSRVLRYLDPVIGFVILLNAIVVLVSTDVARGSEVWDWFELVFAIIFMSELSIKVFVYGPKFFFLGPDMCWNIFDFAVVLLATMDVVFKTMQVSNIAGDFTLIRLLRFARLTKLVRVLKLKAFAELVMLVNGVLVGFRTLLWVVIFWIFLLLSLGVVMTETVGRGSQHMASWCNSGATASDRAACIESEEHLDKYRLTLFGNVFRSMFTVFRCLTGDSSSVDGTPLVPYFLHSHGPAFIVMYMLVFVFVTFGLFNLVMAVFVESTISGAKKADIKRKEAQWSEHVKSARKLQELIVMFHKGDHEAPSRENMLRDRHPFLNWIAESLKTRQHAPQEEDEEIKEVTVSQEAFYRVCERPEAKRLLAELDIDFNSRRVIFDVLDANGNGSLEVTELVQGLLRLRGVGDRCEMVASLLAIRAMQRSLKALEALGLHQQKSIHRLLGHHSTRLSLGEVDR